ncbi:hypothetical protein AUQ44_01915 [Vibrio cidicii]|uniref:Uncharacterized protein n=1 Tax=Vibrio cidicii TaxID=1763883 RepID=A0A151JFW0_9VIBR|nr:hypothetical protein [Vibrio cidicii]KYN24669.1 hypothetical protein AUQ44_01915 [Vibrio cidicii]
MKVIENQVSAWFLLKYEDEYYIDVNCSSGFVSFSAVVKLNGSEKANYNSYGTVYIESLAEAISNKSQYDHPRNIKDEGFLDQIHEAIMRWKQEQT